MQVKRKPEWLKVKLPTSREYIRVKKTLSSLHLHSICEEARCPNMTECFDTGTATFLIMGTICTRNCLYCNVRHGVPDPPDEDEPERLVRAVKDLGLRYVVITSVTRDDLPDGGAQMFARCVNTIRREIPACRVEVLIPDLRGNWKALECIIRARPDVINHNMEVVPALFRNLRPQGDYEMSLKLLRYIHQYNEQMFPSSCHKKIITKSGFMVGFGEDWNDVLMLLDDLVSVHCESVTIGQYQQPTRNHWPVAKYYHPGEFATLRDAAYKKGLTHVQAGPLVRSSYRTAGAQEEE